MNEEITDQKGYEQKSKSYKMSDQELMKKLNSQLLEEEIDDLMQGEERIVLAEGEEYKEVDGIKMIPFSVESDLAQTKFRNGVIVNDESDYDDEDSASENSEGENSDAAILTIDDKIKSLQSLVDLMRDNHNVSDSLIQYENDPDKLIQVTDLATELLYNSYQNIYSMTKDELQKEIEKMKAKENTKSK